MTTELAKVYDPRQVEAEVYQQWTAAGSFHAEPDGRDGAYAIVIPPPNVTAALHIGHALNNTLQDILIRWKRMTGADTLWMPGTDHAGIATQTVVEKRILAEEGKRRTDFQRDEFIARVQAWKDQYEVRILDQLKAMGCSCDWDRTRFTMDDQCARAVREAFFRLFADGLIYRGKRLVNWDPATQTVLADDEVEHETVKGHFWYLRYPLVEPVRVAGVSPASESASADEPDVERRSGRYLPHWTMEGATYTVTCRLADSVPACVAEGWRREREAIEARQSDQGGKISASDAERLKALLSEKIDSFLDTGQGSCLLKDPQAAQIVQDALKHFDGDRYELIAWAVMPNHVHVVVRPLGTNALADILHSWKSFTSHEIDRMLGSEGKLWMEEYYDHIIRDQADFNNQVNYVLGNPAKAGMEDWPWVGMSRAAEEETQERGRDARDTVIKWVTVATTRPETMLGDTAVAINPRDPRAAALVGKMVRLPLVGREIPIIADEYVVLPDPESDDAKARFATGYLKVTPAHDPNDYEIGRRQKLPVINVMAPDGSISDKHGWDDAAGTDAEQLLGMDRFEAREAIVEWFRIEGLLEEVRDYDHEVGHSYRSHVPIEPYLSDQWYINVNKRIDRLADKFGTGELPGTDVPRNSLAGMALAPLLDGRLKFVPERYANNYRNWLENLRDWPISRQLWWGHRIPVWKGPVERLFSAAPKLRELIDESRTQDSRVWGVRIKIEGIDVILSTRPEADLMQAYVCVPMGHPEVESILAASGLVQDPDVLDTWFSSGLWPLSTMGWPDETALLKTFYPTSVLVTAREIITLWVSRMVMFGQYFRGDIPFSDVYIHAMVQDGQGRKMSKSLGNGIDPLDIIDSHGADALRFTLASMATETQDVRMPVEKLKLPDGREMNSSPKFDVGRNFCNKLWNASRFAMLNLADAPAWADIDPTSNLADAWILSRLHTAIRDASAAMASYQYADLANGLYRFMWDDFCDWYLEIAKSRIFAGEPAPKAVVAYVLDGLLRLLHPIIPFITEAIWPRLNEVCGVRGSGGKPAEPMLISAAWPTVDQAWISPTVEGKFSRIQALVRGIREVRTTYAIAPSRGLDVYLRADGAEAELISANAELIRSQARLGTLTVSADATKPDPRAATVLAGTMTAFVADVVDVEAELTRLSKDKQTLEHGIAGARGKLGNEKFLQNAPPAVVESEGKRLAEMEARLASITQALADLT